MSAPRIRKMYVTSISSNTVVLSPEPVGPNAPGAGLGIAQMSVVTTESTPEATFWRTAASCGRFLVTIEAVS